MYIDPLYSPVHLAIFRELHHLGQLLDAAHNAVDRRRVRVATQGLDHRFWKAAKHSVVLVKHRPRVQHQRNHFLLPQTRLDRNLVLHDTIHRQYPPRGNRCRIALALIRHNRPLLCRCRDCSGLAGRLVFDLGVVPPAVLRLHPLHQVRGGQPNLVSNPILKVIQVTKHGLLNPGVVRRHVLGHSFRLDRRNFGQTRLHVGKRPFHPGDHVHA
mmetsp:Transcript_31133/g.78891  ORF Transcript_31133/g.78891 Transcript_31133/m.78891 type:complete len:213 (-) Transcript_31133:415-1053(-)